MKTIGLQDGLALKEISSGIYQSLQRPWTWPGTRVVPGGVLMSLAAAAAFRTVDSDLSIDTLQAHFLSGSDPDLPLQCRVQILSDGGRFATRQVTVEQSGAIMVHVTCSFVRTLAMTGPSMNHCVCRATNQTTMDVTLDDLEPGRTKDGPYMKFQRLPLVYNGPGPKPEKVSPQSLIYTSAALISPLIDTNDRRMHALGIICLSDYHVLDAPPTLHGLTFGLPLIGDTGRAVTYSHIKRFTTLNHSIHFHLHEGFRADDLCYIEVTSPWSRRRRAEVQSRIFDRVGKLVATCVQEAYYVLNDREENSKI